MDTRMMRRIPTGTGAPKTKIFTATWPPFERNEAVSGARVDWEDEDQLHAPRCEITIQMVPKTPNGAPPSGGDSPSLAIVSQDNLNYDGRDDTVVFAESGLLMRNYNSVSLSKGGRYRLSLSECHGIIGSSGSANIASSAPGTLDQSTSTGFGKAKRAGLSFLPVPLSIVFEVNDQVANGGAVIGNFHLLPVAHIPVLPEQLLKVNTETYHRADSDNNYQQAPMPLSSTSSFEVLHASSSGVECTGELATGGRSLAGSGCVAGGVIGVLACLLSGWLVFFRGWKWRSWGTFVNWQGGSLRGGTKGRGVRRRTARKNGARGTVDDGGTSDGSSDSDTILNGHVPDPVGLPRSEEDWRALFDTLYDEAT